MIATYRQQITLAARSMAVLDDDHLNGTCTLTPESATVSVLPFTDGKHDQRFLKLQDACELLADGFGELDRHMEAFVATIPLATHDSGSVDADRFLHWLIDRVDLTEEQRDLVSCLHAQNAVEFVAVKQRLAHVRFQKRLSRNDRLQGEIETNRKLTVHLNPVHVWSTFDTHALLEEEADIPATVLFFLVNGDVQTAVVETEAEDLLRDLHRFGPTSIHDILRRAAKSERGELLNLIRELASIGVIALG